MTYLVCAGTGQVGSVVVRTLRERGAPVIAGSRTDRVWPDGVRGVIADLDDPDAFVEAAGDADGAFVMAGYANEAGLLRALPADARVVLLSASAAASGDTKNPIVAYHVASERAVRASGHPWTLLRPNSFMTNTLDWRDELTSGNVVHAPFADIAVAAVDPVDIGAVAAAALLENGHGGQAYLLTGPEALTPAQQLAILGTAIGRELRLEPAPDEQAGTDFVEIFRKGLADPTTVTDTVQRLLDRPPGTFAAWAQANVTRFS
jgi:uncharacterized protein YbjT (DUF2867 family)